MFFERLLLIILILPCADLIIFLENCRQRRRTHRNNNPSQPTGRPFFDWRANGRARGFLMSG